MATINGKTSLKISSDHKQSNDQQEAVSNYTAETKELTSLAGAHPFVFGPGVLLRSSLAWLQDTEVVKANRPTPLSKSQSPSMRPAAEIFRSGLHKKLTSSALFAYAVASGGMGSRKASYEKSNGNALRDFDAFKHQVFRQHDNARKQPSNEKIRPKDTVLSKNASKKESRLSNDHTKQLLAAMALDIFNITSSLKSLVSLTENSTSSRRLRSTKLRRQANILRVNAVEALRTSQKVEKVLSLCTQHLTDMELRVSLELKELHPALAERQTKFERTFEKDMGKTSAMLHDMNAMISREYAVLFLDKNQKHQLSYKLNLLVVGAGANLRELGQQLLLWLIWSKRQYRNFIRLFMDRNWEYFYLFYFCLINYMIWKIGRESLPGFLNLYMDAVEYVVRFSWTENLPAVYKQIFLTLWKISDVYGILKVFSSTVKLVQVLLMDYCVAVPKFWLKQLKWIMRPLITWTSAVNSARLFNGMFNFFIFTASNIWKICLTEFYDNVISDFVEANATKTITRWVADYETEKSQTQTSNKMKICAFEKQVAHVPRCNTVVANTGSQNVFQVYSLDTINE